MAPHEKKTERGALQSCRLLPVEEDEEKHLSWRWGSTGSRKLAILVCEALPPLGARLGGSRSVSCRLSGVSQMSPPETITTSCDAAAKMSRVQEVEVEVEGKGLILTRLLCFCGVFFVVSEKFQFFSDLIQEEAAFQRIDAASRP